MADRFRDLVRRYGAHPETTAYPDNVMTDDRERYVSFTLDDETAETLDTAAACMDMSRTAYCKWVMRHAGLSVCVGLDPTTMQRLIKASGGDTETFVRDLILSAIKDVPDEESPTESL